jgi:hypothetical protein
MAPFLTSSASFATDEREGAAVKGPGEALDGYPTNCDDKNSTFKQIELSYYPFPKQNRFHGSEARYRLFGGAAGPGKSKALLMETVYQAHLHPNVNTLLLRRTFSELEQSLLLYFRRDVPRELYKSYNESKHVVT